MRRNSPRSLLKSAHSVERETRVVQALGTKGVPVPRGRGLWLDEHRIGSLFHVMGTVSGHIFRHGGFSGAPDSGTSRVVVKILVT